MTELEAVRTRCEKAAADLAVAINAFEHAIADAQTAEAARVCAESIGACYGAFDRVNSAALSRMWQLRIAEKSHG